ncbi:MAG: transposase [Allosphingosinicella sp.]
MEQRLREDLAFRYLAGGATPDVWTLNQVRGDAVAHRAERLI